MSRDAAATYDAVVRLLSTPETYEHRPARVEHVQTHISHVFLAGPYVYKLKKPVRFSFLDFSTLAERRRFCDEELRLNRRLSPAVYLDVVPVVRSPAGTLALGGAGDVVEPVLRMRRLPAARMLPALLARDAVDAATTERVGADTMERLAGVIAAFHRGAPHGPDVAAHAAPAALDTRWEETLTGMTPLVGTIVPATTHAILADFGPRFVARHGELLRRRQAEGRVRDGHGDLHAEHVCVVDAPIADAPGETALPAGLYVFDCLEFSTRLRCTDVAAEIAFLAMDLEHRGRRDLADAFVAAYAAAADDRELVRLVPYYTAARACVRALVACLKSGEEEVAPAERAAAADDARAYLALALRAAWRAAPPAVIACAGRSGTGKSTIAGMLADAIDAEWLRSDALRKRATAPPPSYTAAARGAVYETLAEEADAALAAGHGVIADATFLRRADRDRLRAVAARHGRPCLFVEAVADAETVRSRLARRQAGDLSEARFETYLAQRDEAEALAADEPHVTLATDGALEDLRTAVWTRLWEWQRLRL